MLRVIALTGGIGAGKSTVASFLRERGVVVLSADEAARECLQHPAVVAKVSAFLPDVVHDAGIDRARLAAHIFTDSIVRAKVEEVMHPWIRQRMTQWATTAAQDGALVVVMEIPLLVETRTAEQICAQFDAVITVEAPQNVRLARLVSRGLTSQDALARMAAQGSYSDREAVADVVLENSGTLAQLHAHIERGWATVTASKESEQG